MENCGHRTSPPHDNHNPDQFDDQLQPPKISSNDSYGENMTRFTPIGAIALLLLCGSAKAGWPETASDLRKAETDALESRGMYRDKFGYLGYRSPRSFGCKGLALEAHRGHPGQPENSMTAFLLAAEAGYSGIETDLRAIENDAFVFHHDKDTTRTIVLPRGKRDVKYMRESQWREGKFIAPDGRITEQSPKLAIEMLQAAQRTMAPGQHINVELKTEMKCDLLAKFDDAATRVLSRDQLAYSEMNDLDGLRCLRAYNPDSYMAVIQYPDFTSGQIWYAENELGENPRIEDFARSRFTGKDTGRLRQSYERRHRNWTTSGALKEIKDKLGSNAGLHVDFRTLLNDPGLKERARKQGIKIATYSINTGLHHLKGLVQLKSKGTLPDIAIVDTGRVQTCEALGLRP